MEAPNSATKPELHSVLSTSASVLAVYSYFAGWFYLYFYLGHFGISLWSLEVPLHFFFIYAYSVGTLIMVVLGAIAIGVVLAISTSEFDPKLRLVGLVTLGVVMFPTIFFVAENVAYQKAEQVRRGTILPSVRVTLTDAAALRVDKSLDQANKNNELQLLFETKERIYVIRQLVGNEKSLPIGHIFSLSRNAVDFIDIEVQ